VIAWAQAAAKSLLPRAGDADRLCMTKPSLVFMRSQAKEGHEQYRLRKAETMIRFRRGEARFFLPETKGHDALHARRGVCVLMRRETHGSAIRACPQYPNIPAAGTGATGSWEPSRGAVHPESGSRHKRTAEAVPHRLDAGRLMPSVLRFTILSSHTRLRCSSRGPPSGSRPSPVRPGRGSSRCRTRPRRPSWRGPKGEKASSCLSRGNRGHFCRRYT